jgi:hypothetical protein
MSTRTPIDPWPWSPTIGFHQAELTQRPERILVCAGQTAMSVDGIPQHVGDMAAQSTCHSTTSKRSSTPQAWPAPTASGSTCTPPTSTPSSPPTQAMVQRLAAAGSSRPGQCSVSRDWPSQPDLRIGVRGRHEPFPPERVRDRRARRADDHRALDGRSAHVPRDPEPRLPELLLHGPHPDRRHAQLHAAAAGASPARRVHDRETTRRGCAVVEASQRAENEWQAEMERTASFTRDFPRGVHPRLLQQRRTRQRQRRPAGQHLWRRLEKRSSRSSAPGGTLTVSTASRSHDQPTRSTRGRDPRRNKRETEPHLRRSGGHLRPKAPVVLKSPASAHVTIDTFGQVPSGSFAKRGFQRSPRARRVEHRRAHRAVPAPSSAGVRLRGALPGATSRRPPGGCPKRWPADFGDGVEHRRAPSPSTLLRWSTMCQLHRQPSERPFAVPDKGDVGGGVDDCAGATARTKRTVAAMREPLTTVAKISPWKATISSRPVKSVPSKPTKSAVPVNRNANASASPRSQASATPGGWTRGPRRRLQ